MDDTFDQKMFFFIADISGYTAYMVKNQVERTHGTLVINALIKTLSREVTIPLEISKLEGDAIFLFLPIEQLPQAMKSEPYLITQKLLNLFKVFTKKVRELQDSTACGCGACSNIDELNLKIVAHYGSASLDTIGSFKELSGVDVILVHRLLKNQVKEHRYFLVTKAALPHLPLPKEGRIFEGVEEDKDIGKIEVVVYYPPEEGVLPQKKELTFLEKAKSHFQLAFGGMLLKIGLAKQPDFHNFPEEK